MNKMKAKLKKQGGFTMVEMLIVVAIIAILVAISIPLVNQALEKARDATDQANERAAKSAIIVEYLNAEAPGPVSGNFDGQGGTIISGVPAPYGRHAGHDYLVVSADADCTVTLYWHSDVPGSDNLCGDHDVSHG